MILKVQQDQAWIFFDNFDRISCRDIFPGQVIGVREDVIDFSAPHAENESNAPAAADCQGHDHRKDIWLYGKEGIREIIIDGSNAAYLLSNDGKTIERI